MHNARGENGPLQGAFSRRVLLKAAALAVPALVSPTASPSPRSLQFSLAHLTALGCAPPQLTHIAAHAGYDLVSYRTISMHLPNEPDYDLARNAAMLRETKAALARHRTETARYRVGAGGRWRGYRFLCAGAGDRGRTGRAPGHRQHLDSQSD